jgi:exonuclease SbcC
MMPRIKSLTVRDFRSIHGSITIPMDSPVVLIHGRNGAGKTSLLSAMELGLTGKVSSFDRLNTNLREHLVHKQAKTASVSLCVDGLGAGPTIASIEITSSKMSGDGVLSQTLRTHYSERCYLDQSTLSRLFEIYQAKATASSASPLTQFVKELLGLDALEALIDGLHDAGDVRRLRGNALHYWEARDVLPSIEAEVARLDKELAAAEQQTKEFTEAVRVLIRAHWPSVSDQPIQGMLEFLQAQSHEIELQRMVHLRREVSDTMSQLQATELAADALQLEAAESTADATEKALKHWIETVGCVLTLVFQDLSLLFANLPSLAHNRPEHARATAKEIAFVELERCQEVITRDTNGRTQVTVIEQDRQRLIGRLNDIDQQIGEHSKEAGQLAQALSTIIPHIHSNDCPVCNRTFGEVADTPLLGHVAAKVASLTQSAGRLTVLAEERADTIGLIAAQTREVQALQAVLLDDDAKQQLAHQIATLLDAVISLDKLEGDAKRGEQLYASAAAAAQALGTLRARDQRTMSIRESADLFAPQLGLVAIGTNESLRAALDRFMAQVQENEKQLTAKESARSTAESSLRELQLKQRSIEDIHRRLTERSAKCEGLNAAVVAGDRAIEHARTLLKIAQAERAGIVSRVFNESLNTAWRDLFVRLAPDEPFVPAFSLPGSGKADVEAKLETHYRNGGKGGNPQSMLSAGNLNTAALTLFLALHLSVKAQLPWLVIDDPVQSMDEVHISQFAALLRTLAKQQGRQVIIAVHEKPLFDYLCLELSPAFDGDRLITVELGRAADGSSVVVCNVKDWKQDLAIAA